MSKATANHQDWLIPYSDLTIQEEIGRGSYGKVYRASYLGTDVAVKKIANMEDEEVQLLTEREVTFLRQARHPNIVQFMGVSQHKGGFYIITEFVPKGCVRRWLKDERISMSWKVRVRMAGDVAKAVAYLHSKNIIHRDLKSKNLLVDENTRIKVCDFGLARESDAMRPMSMCGTDHWIAPEILLGLSYDSKADVFSYGVVLAEFLTRKKPSDKVLKRQMPHYGISFEELKSLTPKDAPRKFLELAIDCLAIDPKARPTFPQIVERLRSIESSLGDSSERAKSVRKTSQALPNPERAKSTASVYQSRSSHGSRKKSNVPPRQRPRDGSPEKGRRDAVKVLRFEVQKSNKYGLAQPRIFELHLVDGIVRNITREGELKKQFLVTALSAVVKHTKFDNRLRIDFAVPNQRPYDLEFLSKSDRDKFCDGIDRMMAKDKK